jgi:hypothetical protein
LLPLAAQTIVQRSGKSVPQASTREELDAFGLVLEAGSPVSMLAAASRYRERFPKSEFFEYACVAQMQAAMDLAKHSIAEEAANTVLKHPDLVRKLVLTGTGPRGGKDMDKVVRTTYWDIFRATLTRSDPKEFLFFNRNATGKPAARAFVNRLKERTVDRDAPISARAFQTQLKAIKKWGRSAPADLSKISQPTLIANSDNDRMVPSVLSEDLHRRGSSGLRQMNVAR